MRTRQDPFVYPLYITSRNSESACGLPWETVRDLAKKVGVRPVSRVFEKRVLYRSSELYAAIDRYASERPQEEVAESDADADAEYKALLRRAGLKRTK